MKRLIIFGVVILVIIIGGGLTMQIAGSGSESVIPGVYRYTNSPEASVLDVTSWQAQQMFLFIGFVLFNLIGIGLTLALVMWFLDRQVRQVKAEAGQTTEAATEQAETTA